MRPEGMRRPRQWLRRLFLYLRRDAVRREIEEEMRIHLEMEAEDIAATENLPPEDALRRAGKAFGGVERHREAAWDARGVRGLDDLVTDVRYGLRGLRRNPAFSTVAVLTLALGIGATTAIFSAVSGLLLRPLPYEGADRIVMIGEGPKEGERTAGTTSFPNFNDWQQRSGAFEAMGLYNGWRPSYTGGDMPERLTGVLVTSGVFDVLRVRPLLGRGILPADNVPDSDPVVVLSHDFWKSRLNGDPAVVGRTIRLNGRNREVVGVLPQNFEGVDRLRADVWGNNYFDPADTRASRYLQAIGRLRPEVTLERAQVEMAAISHALESEYPAENKGLQAWVVPLRDVVVGPVRMPVLILFGASAFVLLIVCANLTNLLLLRSTSRARELGIRAALGANRLRTVRQLLTESTVLVVVGSAAGVLLALSAVHLMRMAAPGVLLADAMALDARVFSFTVALALFVTLLVGVLPALKGALSAAPPGLASAARGASSASSAAGLRGVLVVTQLALAMTLLVGTGLLVRTLVQLGRVDPGIRSDSVLTMSMNLPYVSYPDGSEPRFYGEVADRIAALPGVSAAGLTSILPFGGDWDRVAIDVPNQPTELGTDKPEADRYIVSASYFTTMGVRLLQGRFLSETDSWDAPLVAVVDEVFARRIAPDGQAIGLRLSLPGRDSPATVVGIVAHVKHYGLDLPSSGQVYMSHVQYPWRWMSVVARTSVEPLSLAAAARQAVWSVDPEQPVYGITTIAALMAERSQVRRFAFSLMAVFAVISLIIASLGLYGVIAYGVAQRQLEIGIRIALGARPASVAVMVLRQALIMALIGSMIGIGAAVATSRLLQSLLYGVEATDSAVIGAVTAILITTVLVAAWLPARRAAAVSPLQSLRAE